MTRIFRTTAHMFDGPDDCMQETGEVVNVALDLAEVYECRSSSDYEDRTIVYRFGGLTTLIDTPFEAFVSAWEAYRRHADAPHTFPTS